MAGISFKTNAVLISKGLLKKAGKISNTKIPHLRASVFLDRWVKTNFKTLGGKVGGWPPFRESTLSSIRKYDPARMPAKLLQKTRMLHNSYVPFASKTNAGIGSDVPYSEYHNHGTDKLPIRRMLPNHEEIRDDIKRIFDNFIKESLSA